LTAASIGQRRRLGIIIVGFQPITNSNLAYDLPGAHPKLAQNFPYLSFIKESFRAAEHSIEDVIELTL